MEADGLARSGFGWVQRVEGAMSAAAVSSLRHLVLVLVLLAAAATAAVQRAEADDVEPLIGLDYGSEWIKVAVAQGASVDIVLNENTQRKSLAALSFPDSSKSHDELRLFGESAMARPQLALQYIRELLGVCRVAPPRGRPAARCAACLSPRRCASPALRFRPGACYPGVHSRRLSAHVR